MKKTVYILLFTLLSAGVSAQIFKPVKWQFSTKEIDNQIVELIFSATIDKGWHLYSMNMPEDELAPLPTKFVFETKTGAEFLGGVVGKSKLIEEYDKIFEMTVGFYSNSAVFSQKIKINHEKGYKIEGYIDFQACNDEACIKGDENFVFEQKGKKLSKIVVENIEIPQEETDTTQKVEIAVLDTTSLTAKDIYSPVIEQLNSFGSSTTEGGSLLWIFLMGMLGGLLAIITPCVFPVIPMTVSFFMKRSQNKARARRDAVLYGLAIVLIYVALGFVITLIFGTNALNALSTNAIFNVFLFALLVVFALSFFGMFDIALPASWSSKFDEKASTTTGFISILFMAFVLVIVSFSCTGPIIGFLLVNITAGGFLAPILGMFGFAIALALPFSFFAFFPSMLKNRKKSGGWLNSVKVVLAFIELAFALKFFSVADLAYGWHLLDREVFISLWIMIFALLGIYLTGKIRFPHDDEQKTVSVPRFMLGLLSLSFAIYMIPGLWGAPLKAISAFAPPMNTQDFTMYKNHIEAEYSDYELGMTAAKLQKKPVVVDFSGFGCVNCRKMEAAEWTKDKVRERLSEDYILISLMVDNKTPLPEIIEVNDNGAKRKLRTLGDKYSYLQQHKFGANAQPFYVILDENGDPLAGSFTYQDLKEGKVFLDFLDFGLKNYKNRHTLK
ncbi:MAG: thioredoxin family protein [Prevotellaceae bacterium]|jgi:thiol:disulfide interchange protein DsbD|nr:thioredoxin family protein [Prevotellaceae bacterium]